MKRRAHSWLGSIVCLVLGTAVLATSSWAQDLPTATQFQIGPATLRMPADIAAFEAAYPSPPAVIAPILPTMDFADYRLAKAAAAMAPQIDKEAIAGPQGAPSAAVLGAANCNGIAQTAPIAQGFFPPDVNGAIGANHYGEIVNSGIKFSTKALTGSCPSGPVLSSTLAAFFGYNTQAVFDPRILYDLTYNRWIVSAEAFPESGTVQLQFIAVSVDSNPTHGFFQYRFNATNMIGANVFWDYPQIGYDEEAVILTGNKFTTGYVGSTPVFLPKHRMYAGLSFSFCFFNGGSLNVGTLTPPIVLDQGPYTTIATASPGANFIRVHKVNGTSLVCPNFFASNDIAVSTAVPPPAQQPGFAACSQDPAHCLDTIDGRFQSQGTQFGEPVFGAPVRFWQTRTNGAGVFPVPVAYRVNADTLTIEQTCSFFLSGSSMDFNPSIVANGAGTLFVNWSSTDPPNNVNAQVRVASKKFGEACNLIPGLLVNQSGNPLTGNFDSNHGVQRWGDTSSITLDPADTTQAWFANEKVVAEPNPTHWNTRIGNMSNP